MHTPKLTPRAEHRLAMNQRIKDSVTLAERFPTLKSLKVHLASFGPAGLMRSSEIKYSVNLSNAKSLFWFTCSNQECVGGDFDLTHELAKAVAARSKLVTGELVCQGWRNKAGIDQVRCQNMLRYTLRLGF